jgi:hypothetical protein
LVWWVKARWELHNGEFGTNHRTAFRSTGCRIERTGAFNADGTGRKAQRTKRHQGKPRQRGDQTMARHIANTADATDDATLELDPPFATKAFFRSIAQLIAGCQDGLAMQARYNTLSALSSTDLARLGLTRGDIPRMTQEGRRPGGQRP